MNRYRFRGKLHDDVILVLKERTEQNTQSLDYIPGSIFRGIVAGYLFNEPSPNISEIENIIFSKNTLFGDAHLVIGNRKGLKLPLVYYNYVDESGVKKYMSLLDGSHENGHKIKQIRTGYFAIKGKQLLVQNVTTGGRMKSSRNAISRSAQDNGLFYYPYLKKNQEFEFEITTSSQNFERIRKILEGKNHRIAKSKTAEFGGNIEIKCVEDKIKPVHNDRIGKVLYAESNLCFLNEFGEFTGRITPKHFGIKDAEATINWGLSRLRFRTFMPFNYHRKNWDAERLIIEKGSVVVFNQSVTIPSDSINFGVGCYVTEGYGQIKLDPNFISNLASFQFTKEDKIIDNPAISLDKKSEFIKLLENKQDTNTRLLNIDEKVRLMLPNFSSGITNCQWSRVYSIVQQILNAEHTLKNSAEQNDSELNKISDLLFNGVNGIATTGAKKIWKVADVKLIDTYLKDDEIRGFEFYAIRKLAKKGMRYGR